MKRDSVSAYVHMRRDTSLPLYAPVHILDNPRLIFVTKSHFIISVTTTLFLTLNISLASACILLKTELSFPSRF